MKKAIFKFIIWLMKQRSFSIAKLKAGLSSILADVATGSEIIITDHNKPVARLSSIRRLPALPKGSVKDLLARPPVPLRKGAKTSAEIIRRLRDEETH